MTVYVIGFIFGTIVYFHISVSKLINSIKYILFTTHQIFKYIVECIIHIIYGTIQYIVFVHLAIIMMVKFISTSSPLYTLEATFAIIRAILS